MLQKEELFLIVYVITIVFILVLFVVIFFLAFIRRKNSFLQEQYEAKQVFKDELAKSQLEIQEATLKNIAWELHDNVGQLLSVATMQLNILSRSIPEHLNPSFEETKLIIKQTTQEIRSISKVLNNDVVLKNGLVMSIQEEINRFNRLGYLQASLSVIGDMVPLKSESAIILFRIVQESFSNVLKHSKASKLLVILDFREKALEVLIKDNGVGFNTEERSFGSGMMTLKKRAELIEAELSISSEIGKGTKIILKYFYRKNHGKSEI